MCHWVSHQGETDRVLAAAPRDVAPFVWRSVQRAAAGNDAEARSDRYCRFYPSFVQNL